MPPGSASHCLKESCLTDVPFGRLFAKIKFLMIFFDFNMDIQQMVRIG